MALLKSLEKTEPKYAFSDKIELRDRLVQQPVYILLGRAPEDNSWSGLLEQSFSMDWSKDRVLMLWTGTAYTVIGEININGSKSVADQLSHYKSKHPNWEFWAGDARSLECPVDIDWWGWTADRLAGNKFGSRNARFSIRTRDAA